MVKACARTGRLAGRDLAELLFALAGRGFIAEARYVTLLSLLESWLRPLPDLLLRPLRLLLIRLGLNRTLWVEICAERWG